MSVKAARPLLVLAGLALPLLVAECALRIAAGDVSRETNFRPSPVLGWEHRPGVGLYNNLGLHMDRDVEVSAPARRRVLLLGDSFLDDPVFWKALERALRARFPGIDWEVLNAGVAGYHVGQEYLWWHHYGRFLDPDLVIAFPFLGNDWGEAAQRAGHGGIEKPFFLLEDGRLVLHNHPVPRPEEKTVDAWSPIVQGAFRDWIGTTRAEGVRSPAARALYRVHARLRDHVLVYRAVKDLLARTLAEGGVVPEGDRYAPADYAYFRRYGLVYAKEGGADLDRIWDLVEAILTRNRDEVEETGASFLVVAIPHVWQVDATARARFEALAAKTGVPVDLDAPNVRLAEAAARRGWDLIDLLPAYRALQPEGSLYDSLGPESHWNDRGKEVAAGMICDWIASRPEVLEGR